MYIVIQRRGAGLYHVEIISKDELVRRITPRPGETDTYYGGDCGIIFVDKIGALTSQASVPASLLVYAVDVPTIPVKVETVTRWEIK